MKPSRSGRRSTIAVAELSIYPRPRSPLIASVLRLPLPLPSSLTSSSSSSANPPPPLWILTLAFYSNCILHPYIIPAGQHRSQSTHHALPLDLVRRRQGQDKEGNTHFQFNQQDRDGRGCESVSSTRECQLVRWPSWSRRADVEGLCSPLQMDVCGRRRSVGVLRGQGERGIVVPDSRPWCTFHPCFGTCSTMTSILIAICFHALKTHPLV